MIIIGELINGMYKNVNSAIAARDKKIIHELAVDQVKNGASFLDVNVGPYAKNPADDMRWLIETVQEAVDAGVSIDTTKLDVMEAGLRAAKNQPIINSLNADSQKLESMLPLVMRYKAKVIGLTMDRTGIPTDRNQRVEHALKIITACESAGIKMQDVFLDPIVLPVNVAQKQCPEVLASIGDLKVLTDPAPNIMIGLSNVSQGAKQRSLINTVFLIMAVANGVTSAILNPLDKQLMDGLITAELLMNKNIYCDSFLDSYKKNVK